jgi:hypothetical protein
MRRTDTGGEVNIDPKDLRPGDRFRVTDWAEGVVGRVGSRNVHTQHGEVFERDVADTPWHRTWELIERPKPEPKLGSVWVDPEGERWVALRNGTFAHADAEHYDGEFGIRYITNPQLTARLVPAEEQA